MGSVAEFLKSLSFSEDEISARSRIPLSRVKEILRGESVLQSELRALSAGLRIPLRSFASGSSISSREDRLGVLFRDAKVTKKGNVEGALEAVSSFVEASLDVLPRKESFPKWLDEFSVENETYTEAENLADLFRRKFYSDRYDDPAIDLPSVLVRQLNVVLSFLKNTQFEGASIVAEGYCFVFVSPRFPGRMLFTLAHELGHLLAHHNHVGFAIFDRPTEIGGRRRASKQEAFVDAFASCLLLPSRGIARALKTIREIYSIKADEIGDIELLVLARAYGVSFEAAAYRCEQLQLLPSGGASSLNIYLKKNYGSAEKRAEELGLPPRQVPEFPIVSSNVLEAVNKKIQNGEVSVGWASDRLGLSIDDLYDWHSKEGRGAIHH